ncbi:MAG: phasin family protein [Hyphomicrobiaceae bacterium]|nr:phasin family protein [Hyphomicrobiaceae bacterium]
MSEVNGNGVQEAKETIAAAADAFKAVESNVNEAFSGLDVAVPEAVRTVAEKTVKQSREAYENAKDAMEEAVEVLEKSIDQAGQGAAAINRKVIDMTQANLNTGFDLAKDIAGARNIAEIMELQNAFVRKQFEVLTAQAEEIRALSTQIASNAADPLKEHVTRSIDKVITR